MKRNITSKRQYPPVGVEDFKTNEPLLGPSILQYEGTAFLRNVKKRWPNAAGEMSAVAYDVELCLVVGGLTNCRPASEQNTIICYYMQSEIQIGLML